MPKKHSSAYVMRFSDRSLPYGISTVQEHNDIFQEKGAVWIGKWGRPVSTATLGYASASDNFHFILIRSFGGYSKKAKGSGTFAFISRVVEATAERPPARLVPDYYKKSKDISAWFHLDKPFQAIDRQEVMAWVVRSSGKLVLDSMSNGTASFFVADRKPGKIISSPFNPDESAAFERRDRMDIISPTSTVEDDSIFGDDFDPIADFNFDSRSNYSE